MANRLWAEPLKASFGSKQISSPVAFLPLLHGWLVVPFVPDQKLRIDLICWRYKLPVRGEETLSISQDRVIIARRHHLCRRKLGKGAMSNRHFTLLRNVLHNTNESQKIPKILKCWEKSKVKGYLSLSCYASSTWQVFIVFFHYNWLLLVATCLFVNTLFPCPPPPAASCSHGTQNPASVRDPKWPDTAACNTNLRGHEPAKVNPKLPQSQFTKHHIGGNSPIFHIKTWQRPSEWNVQTSKFH